MATKTERCNRALEWLGASGIADVDDLDDNSTEAILCRSNYDTAVAITFEQGDWTFATKYDRLDTPTEDDPDVIHSGFFHIHAKPADCMNLISVDDQKRPDHFKFQGSPWELIGNGIHVDAAIIYIKYIYNETDDTVWSNLFDQTISSYMAMVMSIPLTENTDLQGMYTRLWDMYLKQSKTNDGRQGYPQKTRSNVLLRRR